MSVMADSHLNIVPAETVVLDEKPDKFTLVEFKNGKVVFKQKPLSFEKMSETMQDIVKFREMLEQRIASKAPAMTALPDEHKPLIAKLVHESDKGLQALSRHIQNELLPVQDEDDKESRKEVLQSFPLDVIEKCIKSLALRQNYGVESSVVGGKIPATWQIWRWEIKEEFRGWLPKTSQEKAQVRFLERQQAKKDLLALYQALPDSERPGMIGVKQVVKPSTQGKEKEKEKEKGDLIIAEYIHEATEPAPYRDSQNGSPQKADAENQEMEQTNADDDSAQAKRSRPKKVDPEKVAKEKEREAKRLAKAEKEKKEQEAQNKSRNLFASFFNKSKGLSSATANSNGTKQSSLSQTNEAGPSSPSKRLSDFERTFKPFSLKKGTELAPVNWFHDLRKRLTKVKPLSWHRVEEDIIVIEDDEGDHAGERMVEDDDVEMTDLTSQENPHLGQMTAEERLREALSTMPRTHLPQLKERLYPEFKSYHPYCVRTIVMQLNEAEIAGDDEAVRRLLALLRDRSKIPAKVFIFSEDARPGYYGTWTRNSREVGPRTPFARDVVAVDYSYDSGEEWEEEDQGDADNVDDDDEDEGGVTEEADSDLDSWLADDDEVEPGTPIEERPGSPDFFDFDLPQAPSKRKRDPETRSTKKRKIVVPLIPFSKGPCWEWVIGACEYEPFRGYQIELFNDTPFPIDPFTFVSLPAEERHPAMKTQTNYIPASRDSDFAIPDLPPHVAAALKMNRHLAVPTLGPSSLLSPAAKRVAMPPPKTVFPEEHIPLLLTKINELETGNLTFIVESVHKELNDYKVKKNAIEVKVREIGEKSREGKRVWVVRPEVKASYEMA